MSCPPIQVHPRLFPFHSYPFHGNISIFPHLSFSLVFFPFSSLFFMHVTSNSIEHSSIHTVSRESNDLSANSTLSSSFPLSFISLPRECKYFPSSFFLSRLLSLLFSLLRARDIEFHRINHFSRKFIRAFVQPITYFLFFFLLILTFFITTNYLLPFIICVSFVFHLFPFFFYYCSFVQPINYSFSTMTHLSLSLLFHRMMTHSHSPIISSISIQITFFLYKNIFLFHFGI